METPKIGVASILRLKFIIQKRDCSERVERNLMHTYAVLNTNINNNLSQ